MNNVSWHNKPINEVLNILNVNQKTGLSNKESSDRLAKYGFNEITARSDKSVLLRFLLQFHNPLIYILLTSSFVTAIMKEFVDSSVILGVTLLNAIIGFIQETKAESALKSLRKLVSTNTQVIRDGKLIEINSKDVVVGDIVLLKSGDKVPADVRIIESKELCVNESMLTGESLPVDKKESVLLENTILADRFNMLFGGTLVTRGSAKGVVVSTGDFTEAGRVAHLVSTTENMETPLTVKIKKFSNTLLYIIMFLAVLTFLVGLLRSKSVTDMIMASVALAVGAIPEGLPAAITITLAIGVFRMAKRKAIIRNLPAVETLGSTTIICTDKTGTLTQNKMTVKFIVSGTKIFEVSGNGYEPNGEIFCEGNLIDIQNEAGLKECLKAGLLCNDSGLVFSTGEWTATGDPTETALIVSAIKGGLNRDLRSEIERVDVIPFDSNHQYMATLNFDEENNKVIYIKGSTEKILERTTKMFDGSLFDPSRIKNIADDLSSKGFRVLAFALKRKNVDSISHKDLEELVFLGLQAIKDPPRQEAVLAVIACKEAGIKIKMITGDHALTAVAIARDIGLDVRSASYPYVITGVEFDNIKKEDLADIVEDAVVFPRFSPEQKLRLVEALKSHGHVIAMTGDGVNDAPALKSADIGVAMGMQGTEVAKDSADMIITDDNFSTIEGAVEEGRGVFDNIIKFIVWTIPTQVGIGLVVLASIFAGIVLPILPVQILWLNMTTAVFLGLMLSFEPKEKDIMKRKPRDPNIQIFSKTILADTIIVSVVLVLGAYGIFSYEIKNNVNVEIARTIAVNVFVIVQTFYLFNCRSFTKSLFQIGLFSNKWVIAGAVVTLATQILYTYVPFMNHFFKSAPISAKDWVLIFTLGLFSYLFIEVWKIIRRKI